MDKPSLQFIKILLILFLISTKTKNPHHLHDEDFKIKTGGDLLSRVSSTIGARGLNFCVRNGNR